ncbi:transporter substrate-binding domain-containing protein [Mobilicoccus pelagius]|uniref:Solute-binding protein family 3/N-terminal domain-containing protein n=1 Tax=Mobilicoccus pelagius NBRC 104925 TaxID=1089455 RepID=H5UQP5_9MICO|nr:transporter substrate-binding domain-containing protein [Mobilicoccus pelagius]GAB48053.1 hypothetical protein MOPEL_036_00170 [Mobilicoccus pelagius NBRC 104925]
MHRPLALALATVALTTVGGCGVAVPADPDGTLDRVRSDRVLRVGVAPNAPFTVVTDPATPPGGSEVDLLSGFARRLGARLEFVVGGESRLVGGLEDGTLDVVVGGLLDDSPWEKRAALTRPYAETTGPDDTTRAHVMAVPLGENAMLTELETYLDEVGR